MVPRVSLSELRAGFKTVRGSEGRSIVVSRARTSIGVVGPGMARVEEFCDEVCL